MRYGIIALFLLTLAGQAQAQEKNLPATRWQMKQALDDLKKRSPRLLLPPPTAEELATAKLKSGDNKLGGIVNNARMRMLHLPEELRGGGAGFSRERDKNMSLDSDFKTMLFWIVSRVNNCQYCLGHQESKLASVKLGEDKIAGLDGDWSEFTEKERAAFAFTRKLTYEPFACGPDDWKPLRQHYTDLQILEMIISVAGNNATNRWTDSLGIPQEGHRNYLTPASPKYKDARSKVAPLANLTTDDDLAPAAIAPRPPLVNRKQLVQAMNEARKRMPLLELADEAVARDLLPTDVKGSVPHWVRLLAHFPKNGGSRVKSLTIAQDKGKLEPLLRAQISWIAAYHDRAWYALAHAETRLQNLGQSAKALEALGGSWDGFSDKDQTTFRFVRKLTVAPQRIDDADIANLRKLYSDPQVAELVYRVCNAAFFNRVTEATQLRLEN